MKQARRIAITIFIPLNFPLKRGKTFFVNVSTPEGLNASTQCTIINSDAIAIDSLHIDSTIRNGQYENEKEYTVSVYWTDRPEETNFYRVFVQAKVLTPQGDTLYYQAYNGFNEYVLLEDKNKNGQKMSGRLNYSNFSYSGPFPGNNYKVVGFDAYLLNIDEDYYKYYKSIEKYSDGSNPFTEPSLIYTNVENGFGIFCSYSKLAKSIKL
jgi:hypothetical protein